MTNKNVDLTLLRKLVSELEKTIDLAFKIKDIDPVSLDYNVELAKAIGISSSISQESLLLVSDIAQILADRGSNEDVKSVKKTPSTSN